MTQSRMNQALRLALEATDPDTENRYVAAMIDRAQSIIERSGAVADPETALPLGAKSLAQDMRDRNTPAQIERQLRAYVEAKLMISNPAYLDKKPAN